MTRKMFAVAILLMVVGCSREASESAAEPEPTNIVLQCDGDVTIKGRPSLAAIPRRETLLIDLASQSGATWSPTTERFVTFKEAQPEGVETVSVSPTTILWMTRYSLEVGAVGIRRHFDRLSGRMTTETDTITPGLMMTEVFNAQCIKVDRPSIAKAF